MGKEALAVEYWSLCRADGEEIGLGASLEVDLW